MHHLHDITIRGEMLDLSGTERHYLGPNLVLEDCTVVLQIPATALTVTTVRFRNCAIETKKKFTSFYWCNAFFESSRFKGTFSGSDFGHWPEDFDPQGGIRDCDFSGAILDGARFIGCDMNGMKMPAWPCFTILDPVTRAAQFGSVTWPGKVGFWLDTFRDQPPNIAAITSWAPGLAKKFGATEAELKEVLARFDGVRM